MRYGVWSKILSGHSIPDAAKMVKTAGYDGIEWRIHEEGHVRLGDAVGAAGYLRQVCSSIDLEIVTLGSYIQTGDLGDFCRLAEAAKLAGCSNVRVWAPFYDGSVDYHTLLQRTRENLARIEEVGRKFGVRAVLEIHFGTIIPSAGLARKLVEGFDPHYLGVIYDPGNMVNEGMEAWKMGLQVLGPYVAYVHFKNTGWFRGSRDNDGPGEAQGGNGWRSEWVGIDEGMVSWEGVMRALIDVGFDEYLSNENFSRTPVERKLAGDLKYLKRIEQLLKENS